MSPSCCLVLRESNTRNCHSDEVGHLIRGGVRARVRVRVRRRVRVRVGVGVSWGAGYHRPRAAAAEPRPDIAAGHEGPGLGG